MINIQKYTPMVTSDYKYHQNGFITIFMYVSMNFKTLEEQTGSYLVGSTPALKYCGPLETRSSMPKNRKRVV